MTKKNTDLGMRTITSDSYISFNIRNEKQNNNNDTKKSIIYIPSSPDKGIIQRFQQNTVIANYVNIILAQFYIDIDKEI